jgi:hypothetical protein
MFLNLSDAESLDGGRVQSFLAVLWNNLRERRFELSEAANLYKDDPCRVLEALQQTLTEFDSTAARFLTSSDANRVCDILLGEISQYGREHFNYLCHADYALVLGDIEHLLDYKTVK